MPFVNYYQIFNFQQLLPVFGTLKIFAIFAPKPEDPPFVSVGDRVELGQTICIIEAMKIFNDIDCEISGIVEEVLIENGSPVEYGQKIISIRLDD